MTCLAKQWSIVAFKIILFSNAGAKIRNMPAVVKIVRKGVKKIVKEGREEDREEGRFSIRFTVTIFFTFYLYVFPHVLPSHYGVFSFAMSSIGSRSIFAKANHFLPRSFSEAPI